MGAGVLDVLIGVVVGVVLGTAATYCLELLRERRQAETERKLLAGALAAEVSGLGELLAEVCSRQQCSAERQASSGNQPVLREDIIPWAVEESYSSVYDSAGQRLHLLGSDVNEVIVCYLRVKRALDSLHALQRTVESEEKETFLKKEQLKACVKHASSTADASIKLALSAINGLLPKLKQMAG